MSLKTRSLRSSSQETAGVAWAAFPKGTTYTKMRCELGIVWEDEDFANLFPWEYAWAWSWRIPASISPNVFATRR